MNKMKVAVTSVAIGSWYPKGVGRMLRAFAKVAPLGTIDFYPWINELPPGAPESVEENGYDYTGYAAKAFALAHAMQRADVAILLDAAFWPIAPIDPLVNHIFTTGYYLCDNGFKLGEWSSDRALEIACVEREIAFQLDECSSYAVGVASHSVAAKRLVAKWMDLSRIREFICGPHTADGVGQPAGCGRNPGLVSTDPRVKGHRHDQTALTIAAWEIGTTNFVKRPRFTAYDGDHTKDTVLINRGM